LSISSSWQEKKYNIVYTMARVSFNVGLLVIFFIIASGNSPWYPIMREKIIISVKVVDLLIYCYIWMILTWTKTIDIGFILDAEAQTRHVDGCQKEIECEGACALPCQACVCNDNKCVCDDQAMAKSKPAQERHAWEV